MMFVMFLQWRIFARFPLATRQGGDAKLQGQGCRANNAWFVMTFQFSHDSIHVKETASMIQTVINPSQSLYWTTGSKEGSAQTLKQFLPHVKHAIPSSVANFGLISVETVSPQEFFHAVHTSKQLQVCNAAGTVALPKFTQRLRARCNCSTTTITCSPCWPSTTQSSQAVYNAEIYKPVSLKFLYDCTQITK